MPLLAPPGYTGTGLRQAMKCTACHEPSTLLLVCMTWYTCLPVHCMCECLHIVPERVCLIGKLDALPNFRPDLLLDGVQIKSGCHCCGIGQWTDVKGSLPIPGRLRQLYRTVAKPVATSSSHALQQIWSACWSVESVASCKAHCCPPQKCQKH